MQQPSLEEATDKTYHNAYRGRYDPKSANPYKISRSKIELYHECPRCFYLDRRLGVERPSWPKFTLNLAVDALLKKEFDIHRAKGQIHPLMEAYKIDAIPFAHGDIGKWRDTFRGLEFLHSATNLLIHGAIDDLWQSPNGDLIVVDYKATARAGEVSIDGFWQKSYKRQMEIYQWILRRMGFAVSATGYFVYANGRTDPKAFDGKLEFNVTVIPYKGDEGWVETAIEDLHKCLTADSPPPASANCEYCRYWKARILKKT